MTSPRAGARAAGRFGGWCSTTPFPWTRVAGSTSSSSAAPASRRSRWSTGSPSATSPSSCSSSSCRPTTSTTSPGPTGSSAGLESIVAEAYRILDASLGELLKRAGDATNVLVVSDHGGGSLQGVVNLNAWLAAQGYLAYTETGSINGGGAHRLIELRHKLPKEWRSSVKQRVPWLRERAYRLKAKAPRVIDWDRTRAFSYGIFGNIVLNVAGREREGHRRAGGRVRASARRARERLLGLRWPDGEPIVAAVHRREELFSGPELAKVPGPDRRVPRLRLAGQGEPDRADADSRTRSRSGASRPALRGSHRQEGIWSSPARMLARARSSQAPGSPTLPRRCCTCSVRPIPRPRGPAAGRGARAGVAGRAAAGVRRRGRRCPDRRRAGEPARGRGAARSLGYLE